jgi:hypothetical protein
MYILLFNLFPSNLSVCMPYTPNSPSLHDTHSLADVLLSNSLIIGSICLHEEFPSPLAPRRYCSILSCTILKKSNFQIILQPQIAHTKETIEYVLGIQNILEVICVGPWIALHFLHWRPFDVGSDRFFPLDQFVLMWPHNFV